MIALAALSASLALASPRVSVCETPYASATVLTQEVPVRPEQIHDVSHQNTVLVQVTVDERGKIQNAHLYQPSNNSAVDNAALNAARASTYAPKIVNCQPTVGDVLVYFNFADGAPTPRPRSTPDNCNAPVRIFNMVAPVFPRTALRHGVLVIVRVDVDASGAATNAVLQGNSSIPEADQATLIAAQQSTYHPKMSNCQPVSGSFLYSAYFQP